MKGLQHDLLLQPGEGMTVNLVCQAEGHDWVRPVTTGSDVNRLSREHDTEVRTALPFGFYLLDNYGGEPKIYLLRANGWWSAAWHVQNAPALEYLTPLLEFDRAEAIQ